MLERKIQDALHAIVGEDGFFTEPEDLASYSYDAFVREFMPDAVVGTGGYASGPLLRAAASRGHC